MNGRTGTGHHVCGPVIAGFNSVHFPPRGRETVSRLRMLAILEPVE